MEYRERGGRHAVGGLAATLAVVTLLAMGPLTVNAATLTNSWKAKIGSAGANGTATVSAYLTGTGSIALKLAKLKPSTSLAVTLTKSSCSGATLVSLAAIKTNSAGAAARTTTLNASQVKLIKSATKIAVRIGAGSTSKCGVFAAVSVPPYVATKITVGRAPSGVAVDPSGVWVTSWLDNTVTKIDPATNTALSVVPVALTGDAGLESIASGLGSLWITTTEFDSSGNSVPGSVIRLDPVSGAVLATIAIGKGAFDIAVGAGAVWVPNADDNTVIRIDPTTNQAVATIPISGGPYGVAADSTSVWVASLDGTVYRIDPATNQPTTPIHTQATGGYVAVGSGAVWVTNPGTGGQADGSLTRIDPATNQVVANTPLGATPQEVVVAGGNVWIGMYREPTVVQVSPITNAVVNRVVVSANVYSIDAGAHAVWAVHNLPRPDDSSPTPPGAVTRINY